MSLDRLDGWTVASLAGEIDILTASRLRAHLAELVVNHGGPPRVIIDLGDVTFCDALGLGVLIGVHHAAARHGVWWSRRGSCAKYCARRAPLTTLRCTTLCAMPS